MITDRDVFKVKHKETMDNMFWLKIITLLVLCMLLFSSLQGCLPLWPQWWWAKLYFLLQLIVGQFEFEDLDGRQKESVPITDAGHLSQEWKYFYNNESLFDQILAFGT